MQIYEKNRYKQVLSQEKSKKEHEDKHHCSFTLSKPWKRSLNPITDSSRNGFPPVS